MSWAYGRQTPDTALMRFMARRFPSTATCLDIGSGEGANARELAARGHRVFSIDKDPKVKPPLSEFPCWHFPEDVNELTDIGPFDIIYDINTLCHVERPPWRKINSWLKSNGIFFSICPSFTSPKYIGDGKKFTRTYAEGGLRETLRAHFAEVKIYQRSEPDFRGRDLESFIAVCSP